MEEAPPPSVNLCETMQARSQSSRGWSTVFWELLGLSMRVLGLKAFIANTQNALIQWLSSLFQGQNHSFKHSTDI